MLLRAILCGRVWNGFLLGKAKKEDVPCRFCGKRDGDVHLFRECTFLPLHHVRDLPEFAYHLSLDRSNWPRCLLWHGLFPGLHGISDKDPWSASFGDLASFHLERCLGAYPVDFDGCWTPAEYCDDTALEMSGYPNVWTDGSREDFSSVGGFEVAGAVPFFGSARFTAQYVRSVGQDVSPGKCVLLSISKSVRKTMKLWGISGDGGFWKVYLDVRDLGGHLDFTWRARACTLSKRLGEATVGVAVVGALLVVFQVKLGLVRGKYLPAGLHAAEASYVSSSSFFAFRAATMRAVWSSGMPPATAPAILNLLDGPVGIDPAFHIVWARFRMMRMYFFLLPW